MIRPTGGSGMSEQEDLYRAVLANPDDDAPRLIYADWLDEHGQPERAEFIRIQCAMERIPLGTTRWQPLSERAKRLERQWRPVWTAPAQERVLEARLGRGFVDRVRLTIEQFAFAAEALVRLEPIRVWEFAAVSMLLNRLTFDRLAADPAFTVVQAINTGKFLPDELVWALAKSRYLTSLRTLIVPNRSPSPEAVVALFDAARRLDGLEMADVNGPAMRAFWRRGAPVRLRRLSLVRSHLADQTVIHLAGSAALVLLEFLRLDGNEINDRGVSVLAATEHLTNLRELSLAGNPIGDAGVKALARSPALRNLRLLNLSDCQIDNAGAQALADSPYLDQLECLCLDENRVSVEVEGELTKRFGPGVCSFAWC
jgi:uncharacterized protein (TIGR02996 family)